MSVPKKIHSLFVSLALLALPLVAQQKLELDKLVKIKDWGYQIQPIKGWNSMPADQEDRFAVGRWKQDLDEFRKRGTFFIGIEATAFIDSFTRCVDGIVENIGELR